MNRFMQHIPGFVEGVEPRYYEFETVEELLSLPLFTELMNNPEFYGFVYSKPYIMALYKEGFTWWVLGRTEQPVELPQWEGWKFRGIDGKVYKDNVQSSCGDEITLTTGEIVKVQRA